MILNQYKCHFLFLGHKYETLFINVGEAKIWETKQQKLSVVLIDRDLKFNKYVLSQCKRVGKTLITLIRISKIIIFSQRTNIMKVFIESQFGYCSFMVRCEIWYHFYNLKNMKNTHGGVLLLVKLQAKACNFTKNNSPPWVFFAIFKLYKCYQIAQSITFVLKFCRRQTNVLVNYIYERVLKAV